MVSGKAMPMDQSAMDQEKETRPMTAAAAAYLAIAVAGGMLAFAARVSRGGSRHARKCWS